MEQVAPYAWLITKDHFYDPDQPKESGCRAGWMGPSNVGMTELEVREMRHEIFRMFDDDGNLYYTGIICGRYEGFEPLDDLGTPDAGCTSIEYMQDDGEWRAL